MPEAQPAMPEAQPARSEAQPASQPPALGLAGWASGLAGWPRGGNGRTDGRMDVRTENLPILQDFVPYRGRCPASQRKIYANKEKQGKGIADHLMPLGVRQGSGPDRGQSPVEWGDFPYIRPSV